MSVHRSEVERIAELARLSFDPKEVERLTDELNRVLEHVEVLGQLAGRATPAPATDDVGAPPTRAPGRGEPDPLALGPDELAPRWVRGFYVVPPPPGVHANQDDA